jgi:hypothetical protein
MQLMAAWFKRFAEPVVLPDGHALLTLGDAARYITRLPPAERDAARCKVAMESLTLGAETDASIELARTALMMALNPIRSHPSPG